jgi:hypothetical protein
VSAHEPPFTAWLQLECDDPWCDETEGHRVDLVLVRGLDLAGGPQVWHAVAPPALHGVDVTAGYCRETAGELDDRVHIVWPIAQTPCGRTFIIGPRPLAHTLS